MQPRSNEVVQNPESVGTMWKTTSMRIRGAKTELEEAGLDAENMAESTSKLRDTIMAITNVNGRGGFDILTNADTFKSTYQIIKGISKAWKDISDVDQAALLELLAGKRNANALAAAIENFATAERVLETSLNSEGSALSEHEKWLDSIEAKQQRFSAQYEAFSNTLLDSSLVKFAFDSGTGVLGWLTDIVDTMGAIPPLMSALYGIRSVANDSGIFRIDTGKDWGGSGIGITTAFTANKQSAAEFAAQLDADYLSLTHWESAVASGNHTMDDFNTVMQGASAKARSYAAETRGAAGSATAFRVAQEQAALGAQKVGIASTAASVGVRALNLALNMALAFGVTMAIQAAVTWITSMGKEAEQAAEKMQELGDAFDQTKADVESLESELASVQERLEELDKLAKSGQITPDQTTELKQLQETNQELERELAIKRELADIQARDLENAAVDTYEKTTYRSITGTTENLTTARGTIEVGAELRGAEMIRDLISGMERVKAEQDALRDGWQAQGLTAEEADRRINGLQTTYDSYASKAAEVVSEQKEIADAITSTSGANYEQKNAILAAIDAWMEYRSANGEAASTVSATTAVLEESVTALKDMEETLSGFSEVVNHVGELYDALQSLNELNNDVVPAELLAQILELCPEAVGSIHDVESAQQALKQAIADQKDVAEETYSEMILANQSWLENSINANAALRTALAGYYGNDLDNFRTLAENKWTIERALVADLQGLWAKYEARTLESLENQLYYMQYQSPDPDIGIINELKTAIELRKALTGQFDKTIDFTPSISGGSGTNAIQEEINETKSLFQEKYDAWKHELEMEKITLTEFYAWLDGEDGYRKFFSDQKRYADEWRKYEKEVFDGLRDVHESYLQDLDHEAAVLERQEGKENEIIALYQEKKHLLLELKSAMESYLRAAGMSEEEIARNDVVQGYLTQIYQVEDAIRDVHQTVHDTISEGINDLISLTEDMIRKQKQDEIDALSESKEEYEAIIDVRKQMLHIAEDEAKHRESITEKTKRLAEIEARLLELSRDDSREARMQEGALLEEQAQLSKELYDIQRDYYVSAQEKAYDEDLAEFQKLQDEQIDVIQDFLDDNYRVNQAAMKQLDNMGQNLFDKLLSYALKYSNTTREELLAMWEDASAAAEKYGNITNAAQIYADGDVDTQVQAIIRKMRDNGSKWGTASESERDQLASSSASLGSQLGALLGQNVYRDNNGVWWIGDKKLFEVYHSGTASAGQAPTLKQNEVWAKIEKGESVLTQGKQAVLNEVFNFDLTNTLTKFLNPLTQALTPNVGYRVAATEGPNVNVYYTANLTGNITDETLGILRGHSREVASIVSYELRRKR